MQTGQPLNSSLRALRSNSSVDDSFNIHFSSEDDTIESIQQEHGEIAIVEMATNDQTSHQDEATSMEPSSGNTSTAAQPTQVHVPYFNACAFIQPSIYDGRTKPKDWINQVKSWAQLQKLSDENAINALTFYLTGSAKMWFESLPSSAKTDLRNIFRLLEIRFTSSDDDELLASQWATENVQEYMDRLIVKARMQNVPENLLMTIAKKGFNQALKPYIIQRNPKNMEELKDAAIIAEKCLASTLKNQISVNAISQMEFKSLNESIKCLSDKVESLSIENKQFKTNFGKPNPNFENQRQNFQRPGNNFGRSQVRPQNYNPNARPYTPNFQNRQDNDKCRACEDRNCSGKRETCKARDAICFKCEKKGHFTRLCRSRFNMRGQKISH